MTDNIKADLDNLIGQVVDIQDVHAIVRGELCYDKIMDKYLISFSHAFATGYRGATIRFGVQDVAPDVVGTRIVLRWR